jgi:phosphate starvation-inducible protein PhoH
MSSKIPYRFGYKKREMTATESARVLLKIKREETLSKIKQSPKEKLLKQANTTFRFNKILIMNEHALNDLTHMDPKDVVSASGKLITGSPYNN